MIDYPEQVERLMDRLGAALPIPARLTPEVQITLRQQRGLTVPADCSVTWISYAGDEGGIVCRLEAAAETAEAVFASITHLRFDPRAHRRANNQEGLRHNAYHPARQSAINPTATSERIGGDTPILATPE